MFVLPNPERCTGCKICEFICLKYHFSINKEHKKSIKVYRSVKLGIFFPVIIPQTGEKNSELVDCNLCEGKFNCVKACPYNALELAGHDSMGLFRLKKVKEKILKYFELI